ncbi:MAG: NUDIX hydrolase [Prevotellaceae bacterium]|nr:NUDIX hydrolase [Prevotellaceae bacterium]
MNVAINPYVSVDCVLLGFDGQQLNALVIRQSGVGGEDSTGSYKLPGSLIFMDENLDEAAQRVLKQFTGLVQVNMMQFKAFGGADRLKNPADSVWLERFHNLDHHIERIVTIAYTSLLRIDRRMEKLDGGYEARWMPVGELPPMAFDHNDIVREAVESIRQRTLLDPTLLFDLLPRKFTATQLRVLMETVQGVRLDVKNFHKKMATMPYVVPLEEKEDGVSHRAARYYKFKRRKK